MAMHRQTALICAMNGIGPAYPVPNKITLYPIQLQWHYGCGWISWCVIDLPDELLEIGTEIIPCLSTSVKSSSHQFFLYTEANGDIQAHAFAPIHGLSLRDQTRETESEFARVDTDMATIIKKPNGAYLELIVEPIRNEWPNEPYLIAVSISKETEDKPVKVSLGQQLCYGLTALSQFELESDEKDIMCSPTSVAMVLGFHKKNVDPIELAQKIRFHEIGPKYGVWPANVWAASQYGLIGYVLQFPNWESACSLLNMGVPIIASIRYGAFELDGAPKNATPDGHMIVLAGYSNDTVMVYDPAAPDSQTVRRKYNLTQFCDAWFNHYAIGYVLF